MSKVVKNDWTGSINGSTYTTASSDAITPTSGNVFVAITMLSDTVFDSASGLVAESSTTYVNTEGIGAGAAGLVVDSVTFPKGVTIYGRWTEIDVSSGTIVAYQGI